MRKLLVLSTSMAGMLAGPAFGQATGGGLPVDDTSVVKSHDTGIVDRSTNVTDQLIQRQGLQDLASNQRPQKTDAKLGPARPAKKGELTIGAAVNDRTGAAMAKIEAIEADGIVVSMGSAKVKVPSDAFGHNKAGLLLDMTKAQFEQVVAQAK